MYSKHIRNIILMLFSMIFIIGLSGCGGGDSSDKNSTIISNSSDKNSTTTPNNIDRNSSTISNSSDKNNTNTPVNGTAQLGNLADANVTVYKIEDNGTATFLWNEITSSGTTLADIGKFNLHIEDLNDSTFYLYKVKGGKDWDANDDGIKDANYTKNNGTIRAIAKGSDIKVAAGNFTVSYVTELLYEKVESALKYTFNKNTFQTLLINESKKIVKDVNHNDVRNMQDILTFNPSSDKNDLTDSYKTKVQEIINSLHDGKIPFFNPFDYDESSTQSNSNVDNTPYYYPIENYTTTSGNENNTAQNGNENMTKVTKQTAISYDNTGRAINENNTTYTYDENGNLTSIKGDK